MSQRAATPSSPARWRAAADIGGTFTDLVLVDSAGTPKAVAKLLTTPEDFSEGLLEGLQRLLSEAGIEGEEICRLVHGTTIVTNALIERAGAATALLTTAGFRDVLEIGREDRYDLYDLDLALPEPLVPRRWRREISARVLADGTVRSPVDVAEVRRVVAELADEGVISLAVTLLHGYAFEAHEHEVEQLVHAEHPEMDITLGSQLLPQLGEFDRTSTAVANAYVRPAVRAYLERLQQRLAGLAADAELLLVTSSGKVTPAATAMDAPIRLLESGPAGGVLAASATGRQAGEPDCLTFDMGGTTAKACYVVGSEPRLRSSFEVARVHRFTRGSGLPIQVPSIELIEIGAGGGSVAWIDGLGLLKVGPRSAGSQPGPACYGFGGDEPTVTDADLVLGFLDPNNFLGGTMVLDPDAATKAIGDLARRLDLDDVVDAARSIRQVVDEQMAAAARMHAVEQGLDSTRFALVATGGAGPMHACSVARILGITTVLVPARAGVASAYGFLGAPFGYEVARSQPVELDGLDWNGVRAVLDDLEADAQTAAGGIAGERRVEADLRYRGQGAVVTVEIPEKVVEQEDTEALHARLEDEYQSRYHRVPVGAPVELLTWRLTVSGSRPTLGALPVEDSETSASANSRPVAFTSEGFVDTRVVSRANATGEGPLIVAERESTTVVPPGARVQLQADDTLRIELGETPHG